MAIAEHNPEMLYKRNSGMKEMSKEKLHEFAKTKEVGLRGRIASAAKREMFAKRSR